MPDSSETGETGGKSATGREKGSHVTRVSLLALAACQYIRSMSSWEMRRTQLGPVQTVVVWTGPSFVSSYVLIRREGIGITKPMLPVAAA